MMMRNGEREKEFLRPFVDSKAWDCCIIWKFGDDPSRFLEWVGCCCSGSYIEKNIKLEEGIDERKENGSSSICRDEDNKHHIRTLACEALSHFPLSMPLYPGIHGEVVMSKSPKWFVNSGQGPKQDIFSTRVLVPVSDGVIELFSFTMKPYDEMIVDLIMSRCNAPRGDESTTSTTVSNPSNEPHYLFGNYTNEDVMVEDAKADKKVPKENFKSKNLHSERKRRDRIKQGLYALRAVVPKITKMDKAGTLSDAIDYINELLVKKHKLEEELKGISDKEEEPLIPDKGDVKVSSRLKKKMNKEVNLEVHKIDEREFMIRVSQEYTRDGFEKLLEAVDSCGLEIVDVNFNRLGLTVMTLLNVKANNDGIESGDLRDFLFKMMIT